jgi:hypothetical protein
MNHVLFSVHVSLDVQTWTKFLRTIEEKLRPYEKNFRKISESVWLVDNKAEPRALAWLLVTVEHQKFDYDLAAFDTAPEWLLAGSGRKTNQV